MRSLSRENDASGLMSSRRTRHQFRARGQRMIPRPLDRFAPPRELGERQTAPRPFLGWGPKIARADQPSMGMRSETPRSRSQFQKEIPNAAAPLCPARIGRDRARSQAKYFERRQHFNLLTHRRIEGKIVGKDGSGPASKVAGVKGQTRRNRGFKLRSVMERHVNRVARRKEASEHCLKKDGRCLQDQYGPTPFVRGCRVKRR